ncbi:MAG: hypothetical protein KDJ16_07825, partial [Hyphomicrobiales bacterium]|nr:hypothetical protein [Hyphomicrobiales bacterium]
LAAYASFSRCNHARNGVSLKSKNNKKGGLLSMPTKEGNEMASKSDKTTLTDDDIVTSKKVSRRSLLVGAGIAVGGAAAMAASGRKAAAADQKEGDMSDRTPPKIDGSRDTD